MYPCTNFYIENFLLRNDMLIRAIVAVNAKIYFNAD